MIQGDDWMVFKENSSKIHAVSSFLLVALEHQIIIFPYKYWEFRKSQVTRRPSFHSGLSPCWDPGLADPRVQAVGVCFLKAALNGSDGTTKEILQMPGLL